MYSVPEPLERHGLQCMEIWGGSHAASRSASTPGLDIWVYSRPHQGAPGGGDVHYVSLCGGGIITRFILADVAGHGASVVEPAQSLRDLMRRNINRKSQAKFIKELNRQFALRARSDRFATAVVATYLTTTDRLALCNAGHVRPLWYRADAGRWSVLGGREGDCLEGFVNLPLGIDSTTSYGQVELALGRGDLVLLYTDGLTEMVNSHGQQLGETGLVELIRGLDAGAPGTLPNRLVGAIDRFLDGKPAEDDMTFLLFHHNAGDSARLSLRQKLDVYAKVFHLKSV